MEKIESEKFPGFYHLPFTTSSVLINNCGVLIKPENGEPFHTHITKKGYVNTRLRVDGEYRVGVVHRLVAMLFVEVPDRHRDKSLEDLQVNHIDGIKTNNYYKNLEWVTGTENMLHARESGLFSNDVPVLSRDIRTNEVVRYRSISECARQVLADPSVLAAHLRSVSWGRVTKDWMVFKYDDDRPWPTLLAHQFKECTLGYIFDVVAKNVNTGETILFTSLVQACAFLNLNLNIVKNNRTRKGHDVPYQGWVFIPLAVYREQGE